jgi:CubicO group peptidase (beta-lactamase class C family)
MLLTHTSGHEYDWFNPLLGKWRASRGEEPWTGPTVEAKSTLPLVFEPGTSFAYGGGLDWAGKMVEKATGETLETFMSKRIWKPLGIKDVTFFPDNDPDIQSRLATISTMVGGPQGIEDVAQANDGDGRAVDAPDFDIRFGATECLGGGGLFASSQGYFSFLHAVLKRDSRLLNPDSWVELFKPQLDEKCEAAFNKYLNLSPAHTQFLSLRLPPDIRKTFSFAGAVCLQGQEGRMNEGTVFWGGTPSIVWVSCAALEFLSLVG